MFENCNFLRSLVRRIAVAASVVALATVPYSAKAQTIAPIALKARPRLRTISLPS